MALSSTRTQDIFTEVRVGGQMEYLSGFLGAPLILTGTTRRVLDEDDDLHLWR
jgi:hypothetical protein